MASPKGTQKLQPKQTAALAERRRVQTLLKAIIPYLPQPVVEKQLANPEVGRVTGEYWEGAVLFADLSGFTALSETLSGLGSRGAGNVTVTSNKGLFFTPSRKELYLPLILSHP